MIRLKHVVRSFLAALFLIGPAMVDTEKANARSPYDGRWSVLIITERGTCDRAYRYPVQIVNGRVTYAGGGSFNVSGQVRGRGAVTVTVSQGSSRASGRGRLSRSYGSGVWSGRSSANACSGVWQAERR